MFSLLILETTSI